MGRAIVYKKNIPLSVLARLIQLEEIEADKVNLYLREITLKPQGSYAYLFEVVLRFTK